MTPLPSSIPALITGASSGIGEQFARQLAARGHNLVVVARRTDRLRGLASELRRVNGVDVDVLPADLETREGQDLVAARLEAGGPWLLVNNAGFGTRGRLAELPVDREQAEVMVNVVAVHRFMLTALHINVAAGTGGIINVASQAAFQPIPYMASYAATKVFVLHLTEAAAVEASSAGVQVMALCPGPVRTEFTDGHMEQEASLFGLAFMDVDRCVRIALRSFDKGHTICTPGLAVTGATLAARFVPRRVLRTAVGRVQELLSLDETRDPRPAAPATTPPRARTPRTTSPRRPRKKDA
jgi:short-subunit dehydrogenase